MSQRLFNVAKVGVFLDDYSPAVEKRSGEEVKVLVLKLRVQPFDAKLAAALDEGVGEDSNIRQTVFSLNTGDPKPGFTRHDFKLGLERQNLELFSTPDTEVARMVLLQAKISGTYVREQKDMNAMAFVFKASFGPVGRDELELIHSLHRAQTFITFHESEPLLGVEDDGEDEETEDLTDADEKARRPALTFVGEVSDEAPAEPPTAREVGARRKLHTGRAGKNQGRRKTDAVTDESIGDDVTVN